MHRRQTSTESVRFNPLPAREPGATSAAFTDLPAASLFQSSPGPRAGSNAEAIAVALIRDEVSILSRPASREQREVARELGITPAVSILSRPASREQPCGRCCVCNEPGGVSILSRPASREQLTRRIRRFSFGGFQSSPGPRAGSNAAGNLSRTVGACCFNPLPAREPGAT